MTIVTEHNLKPAAAVEAAGQLFIYSSLFSIIETINRFLTHWNSQSSVPITTTCSQGINYTDHLSVMWMSGPEGVTGKAKKKKKKHTQWCTHMPRWSFLHVDKGSDPKVSWCGAFTHLHGWTLARGKCFRFFFLFCFVFKWSSFLL